MQLDQSLTSTRIFHDFPFEQVRASVRLTTDLIPWFNSFSTVCQCIYGINELSKKKLLDLEVNLLNEYAN